MRSSSATATPCFNPRTREGCDCTDTLMETASIQFQSTHPRGVRLPRCHVHRPVDMFQSTHPRGVRPEEMFGKMRHSTFQSTHPRGVRLVVPLCDAVAEGVSIHAPARGATAWAL